MPHCWQGPQRTPHAMPGKPPDTRHQSHCFQGLASLCSHSVLQGPVRPQPRAAAELRGLDLGSCAQQQQQILLLLGLRRRRARSPGAFASTPPSPRVHSAFIPLSPRCCCQLRDRSPRTWPGGQRAGDPGPLWRGRSAIEGPKNPEPRGSHGCSCYIENARGGPPGHSRDCGGQRVRQDLLPARTTSRGCSERAGSPAPVSRWPSSRATCAREGLSPDRQVDRPHGSEGPPRRRTGRPNRKLRVYDATTTPALPRRPTLLLLQGLNLHEKGFPSWTQWQASILHPASSIQPAAPSA